MHSIYISLHGLDEVEVTLTLTFDLLPTKLIISSLTPIGQLYKIDIIVFFTDHIPKNGLQELN